MTRKVHYQGEHWRRAARLVVCGCIVPLAPGLVRPRPIEQMLAGVVLVAAMFLLAEWPLARRVGFSIAPEALTMHTMLGWRRLRWDEIDHFAWQRWRGSTEGFYAFAADGRRTLIPSLQRGMPGWRGRYLGSSRVRTRDGRLGDALEVLEAALDASHGSSVHGPSRQPEVTISPSASTTGTPRSSAGETGS